MKQNNSKLRSNSSFAISRFLIPFVVLITVAFWPEKFNLIAMPLAFIFAILITIFASNNFSRIFLHSFVASSIIAYLVYAVTAPIGDFAAPSQTSGSASDSQFFLFEARRFIYDNSIDALYSTWGSFIPVIFGSGALLVFSDNYIGVVFFNSLLYSFSVSLASRIFKVSYYNLKFLPLLGWMPLQAFYNSMISKEPIYIFLIISSVYIITKNSNNGKISLPHWLIFISLLVVCLLLRPIAAIVVVFVCFTYLFYKSSIGKVIFFVLILTIIFWGAILLANYLEYNLPVNISYEAIIQQSYFIEAAANEKGLDSNIIWLFTPPWSVFLSPILGVLWMVSPLPLLGSLISQIELIFYSSVSFQTLATIIRYMDAMLMAFLLSIGLSRTRRFSSVIYNPLIFITIILVLATVMFQFLESGRHRYLPGFVLVIAILASNLPSKSRL
jgi:hypothetical protein